MVQCMETRPNKIVCGCQTHVNAMNSQALFLMDSLQKQYAASNCPSICQVPCPPIGKGTCMGSSGGQGTCVDM
jgi:hypothetical protein